MSLCIAFCHTIPATYEGRELKATKAQDRQNRLDWNRHPLKITQMEIDAVQFRRVLEILEGNFTLPSKAKGIRENARCDIVVAIDDLYRQGHQDYMESLDMACRMDADTIEGWYKKYGEWKACARPFAYFLGVIAAGAGIVACISPAAKGGHILVVACAAGAILLTDRLVDHYILREGSTHRIKWIVEVNAKELQRFEMSRQALDARIRTIQTQHQELGNETDRALSNELEQLTLIKTLFSQAHPQ